MKVKKLRHFNSYLKNSMAEDYKMRQIKLSTDYNERVKKPEQQASSKCSTLGNSYLHVLEVLGRE